ncbi:Hemolysin transporter protein ShlB precursor [Pseudomonas aeruginosa]|nr:Hemolysin transporter protein ShlB precursor [Pseudomonas aeruginosa]
MALHRLAFIFLCLPLMASAAPFTSPGDRDLIRDRQQRLLDEQRKRLEELSNCPQGAPLRMPPATTSAASRSAASSWKAPGTSAKARVANCWRPTRALPGRRPAALLKAVTDHYLDRGYVTTRAYLPQQDLASGTLRIIVVEGRLEGLDSSALASPRELAMSFPGRTGELLDLRELEQLVDQLSRLPSRQAQLELVPGSEVGGSRRLRASATSPGGSPPRATTTATSAPEQMGLGLDWDSPLLAWPTSSTCAPTATR